MPKPRRKKGQTWPGLDPDEPGPLDDEADEPFIEFLRRSKTTTPAKPQDTTEPPPPCQKPRRRR